MENQMRLYQLRYELSSIQEKFEDMKIDDIITTLMDFIAFIAYESAEETGELNRVKHDLAKKFL